jgi:hypothetical protein
VFQLQSQVKKLTRFGELLDRGVVVKQQVDERENEYKENDCVIARSHSQRLQHRGEKRKHHRHKQE